MLHVSTSRQCNPATRLPLTHAHRVVSGRVAGLSLMPYSEDADYIERRIEAMKRKVPGCSVGDGQFPNVSVDTPPDEGMGFQDADSASDVQERLLRSLRRG